MIKTLHHMHPAETRPLAFGVESVTEDFSVANFDRLRARGSAILSAEEKTIGDDKYIYNPSCLVNDGRSAWFKASWTPEDYPASRVVWSSDNAQVRFLGGNTGAEACVYTSASTVDVYTRLSLQFGDCPSARPSFGAKIVERRMLKVHVAPVRVDGEFQSLQVSDYKVPLRIYEQVGLTILFQQEDAIDIPSMQISRRDSASVRACLRGKFQATQGKILYVLPFDLLGSAGFAFAQGGREIAVGANRAKTTLAHELGHALGLFDLYVDLRVERPLLGLSDSIVGATSRGMFPDVHDWNGGAGTRYYQVGQPHAQLVKRHLMYGAKSDGRADITLGCLLAVSYKTEKRRNFDTWCPPAGQEEMRLNEEDLVTIGGTSDD